MTTIAEQFREEGRQQAIAEIVEQLKEEGRQRGMQGVLKRQLKRRFGELSATYAQRIDQADSNTLLYWSERILDASTLEEVFEESTIV